MMWINANTQLNCHSTILLSSFIGRYTDGDLEHMTATRLQDMVAASMVILVTSLSSSN